MPLDLTNRESFRAQLSGRLNASRNESGLSLQALADKMGISRGSLGDYFRGDSEPSSWMLARLADAMGVDPNFLLGFPAAGGRTKKKGGENVGNKANV